jgi:tRNA A-37 threonylcarbamoyl transferase component Bud32
MGAPGPLLDDRPSGGPGPGQSAGGRPAGEPAASAGAEGPAGADTWLIGGRYRLAAPIGHGAMGTVWRARDELLDRVVAVKEVRLPAGLSEAERDNLCQRTLREARTAARLSHPAVATVHDVVEEHGRTWIVMELVHGRPLDRVLARSGPLPPKRAAEVGRQLLAALAAAHGAGVLHRDVKPGNVLLTRDGGAVLTDFGVATIDGDASLTQAGVVVGTPAFMAPERIRGEVAAAAADLWSLGATLYAAVEGRGPYDHCGGAAATMAAIITGDPAPPKTAGPLAAPITALLSRDPAARPSAAAAMGMLEAAAGAAAGARGHRNRPGRSRRRARRAPPRAVVAAMACLMVALPVSIWGLGHTAGRTRTPRASQSLLLPPEPVKSLKPLHRKAPWAAHPGRLPVPPVRSSSGPSPSSTPSGSRGSGTGSGTQCATTATADISADCYSGSLRAVSVTAATGDMNPRGVDGRQAAQLRNGDYLEYPGINFGAGSTQFDARVASGAAGGVSGMVEVVLDNPSSAPVASLSVATTGGWASWETVPANMADVTGTHTVYLEFSSAATGNPPCVSLHYFTFPVS